MNKEELMITKEDLVNWLNRLPNNDDIDLIGFITTRLENFYKLQQENKQLKEQLLVTQDNEETFRLEMEDITQTLGLDEDALFDDVKAYAGSLKDNWNKLKEYVTNEPILDFYNDKLPFEIIIKKIKDKIQELEKGCDSNVNNG